MRSPRSLVMLDYRSARHFIPTRRVEIIAFQHHRYLSSRFDVPLIGSLPDVFLSSALSPPLLLLLLLSLSASRPMIPNRSILLVVRSSPFSCACFASCACLSRKVSRIVLFRSIWRETCQHLKDQSDASEHRYQPPSCDVNTRCNHLPAGYSPQGRLLVHSTFGILASG